MANVYLSLLGTNNYLPCNYFSSDGFRAENVRFIQEATVRLCCRDWTRDDRILIFTTGEASRKNWVDNGHRDREGNTPELEGLHTRLQRLNPEAAVTNVPIPEGKNQDEIWRIFEILFENIRHEDRVTLDITHSFRSIPLLTMVVLNYAKALRNITLEGIYYGAFEVLGAYPEVAKMPVERRNAPIFDLTPFDWLLDWTVAVDRFVGAGDARRASELAEEHRRRIWNRGPNGPETSKALCGLSRQLATASKDMATCRGPRLAGDVAALKSLIEGFPESGAIPPLKELLQLMGSALDDFSNDDVRDGIAAARFCGKHNLVQQGYTILTETLITCLVRRAGGDVFDRDQREAASNAFGIFEKSSDGDPVDTHGFTLACLDILRRLSDPPKVFRGLTETRNDLNHAGWRKKPLSADTFDKKLAADIDRAERLINALE